MAASPQAADARVKVLVLVPNPSFALLEEPRFLLVTQALPGALVANALAVSQAYREYQERSLAREGLRRMYIGTLTLSLFLAVFGGLYWMNIAGLLIGPVIVAFFLALYTMYVEDYLGEGPVEAEAAPPNLAQRALAWLARKWSDIMERRGNPSRAERALRAADVLDGGHTAEELVAQHQAEEAASDAQPEGESEEGEPRADGEA